MTKYQNIDQIKELKPKVYRNIGETQTFPVLDNAVMEIVVLSLIATIIRDILDMTK
jgi:hypothetical protein